MKDPSKIKNCGNGRSGSKRQLGIGGFRTTLDGLRKSDIRRLARRAGVKRISETFYDVALKELESYLKDILPEIIVYIEHARRTTVMPIDVLRALKRRGQTLYGFWPGAESLAGILAPRYKRIGNICRPLIRPVISPVKAYAPEREPTSKELPAISAGKLQALQEAIATFFLQEHIDSCSIDSLIAHVRQQQGTTVNEVVAVVGALEEENRLMCRDGTVWLI